MEYAAGTVSGLPSNADADLLREQIQRFVRSFGLLVTRQTPCGQPVSPSYAHALMVLLERDLAGAPMTQTELGAALGIDKSNVARLCSRLENARHAEQVPAPDDARSRLVSLTATGKRMAQRITEASRDRFARITAALPRSERATVLDSLTLLNEAVETLREDSDP
jgi:DNA-binding MarR family transcriptional regulator